MSFPTWQSDDEEAEFGVMDFSYWTVRQPLSPKAPLHHDIDLQCLKQLILIVGIIFRASHLYLSRESHNVITYRGNIMTVSSDSWLLSGQIFYTITFSLFL